MTIELPDALTIRGNAVNTAAMAQGHGIYLDHDDAANLISHPPVHFLVDHTRSIKNVAGTMKITGAQRNITQVPLFSDGEQVGTREEVATVLRFRADLSAMHTGYEDAARHILAVRQDGRVPNVSLGIRAQALEYEAETERFVLKGPFELDHLGLVDVGAFSDQVGVGVFEVEAPEEESTTPQLCAQMSAQSGGNYTTTAFTVNLHVQGIEDLVADFLVKDNLSPERSEKLAGLLKMDSHPPSPDLKEIVFDETSVTFDVVSTDGSNRTFAFTDPYIAQSTISNTEEGLFHTTGPYMKEDTNIDEDSRESTGEKTMNDMSDAEAPVVEVDAQEVVSEESPRAEPSLDASAINALMARVDALEAERDEAIKARLTSARARLVREYGFSEDEASLIKDASVADLMIERLDAAGSVAPAEGRRLPSVLPDFKRDEGKETFLSKRREAQDWHATQYLGDKEDLTFDKEDA